jgi:hypothetical protein
MPSHDRPGQGSSAFRAFLRDLPDEIERARLRGQPITFPAAFLADDSARRLLETLGVEIVEEPERVGGEFAIREALGLPKGWDPAAKPLTDEERSRGLELLEAMDRGESVAPREPVPAETNGAEPGAEPATSGRAKRWTQETALAAVKAYAARHGHPPSTNHGDRSVLTQPTAWKLFGSWANMIEQAGFERPIRGKNRRGQQAPAPERNTLERIDDHARRERERSEESAARAAERTAGTEKEPETPPRFELEGNSVSPVSLEEAGAMLLEGAATLFLEVARRLRA